MVRLSAAQRTVARPGLRAIVGSPFRIKQIEDGKEGVACPHCLAREVPRVCAEGSGSLRCRKCSGLLYNGEKDEVVRVRLVACDRCGRKHEEGGYKDGQTGRPICDTCNAVERDWTRV